MCLCRFLAGCFNNIFTVGRDFLFEVSVNKRYRIFGFSMKSVFVLSGCYFGPWIGYCIYQLAGEKFNVGSKLVSIPFFVASIAFFIIFNLLPIKIKSDLISQEEGSVLLLTDYTGTEDNFM